MRILLDLIERTKESVRKSDRQEASRIQKIIMFSNNRAPAGVGGGANDTDSGAMVDGVIDEVGV